MRFSLATIVFETFELILCQKLSSQGKNAPSNPLNPHYLVRLATSRFRRRHRGGGGTILLHCCGSPDPFLMQHNEPFVPLNLHFCEGNPLTHRLTKGVFLPSECLLESPFLEPLVRTRTLLRTLLPSKTHCKTDLLRTLLRTFSEAVSRTLLGTLLRRRAVAQSPLVCTLKSATAFSSRQRKRKR